MANNQHTRWVAKQLPDWIQAGIVSEQTAEQLTRHLAQAPTNPNRMQNIFSVLGVLLVGLGAILILAHNWPMLSRPVRAVIAFLPLIVTQGLGFWHLHKKGRSAEGYQGTGYASGFQEAIAIGIALSIGLCIALISQTFHTGGTLPQFLLAWSLLALPLMYIFNSVLVACFYLIATTVWFIHQADFWEFVEFSGGLHSNMAVLPLVALIVPFLIAQFRQRKQTAGLTSLSWVSALCLAAVAIQSFAIHLPWFGALVLFAAYRLTAFHLNSRIGHGPALPFKIVGAMGTLVCLFALSFFEAWEHSWLFGSRLAIDFWHSSLGFADMLFALLVVVVILLTKPLFKRADAPVYLFYSSMLLLTFFTAFVIKLAGGEFLGALTINVLLAAWGVTRLVWGLKHKTLSQINKGLMIIGLLIAFRFFDSDLPFTIKGMVFVVLGAGFLLLSKRFSRQLNGAPA